MPEIPVDEHALQPMRVIDGAAPAKLAELGTDFPIRHTIIHLYPNATRDLAFSRYTTPEVDQRFQRPGMKSISTV